MSTPEAFVPLEDTVIPRIVDNFTELLSELSSSFRVKDADQQRDAIARNLTAALENPNTTVLVHYDPDDPRTIDATITTNVVSGFSEAWIDDVVRLPRRQRKGLGRMAMDAAHTLLRKRGDIQIVRLTSSHDRETAGDLYADRLRPGWPSMACRYIFLYCSARPQS